MAIMVDTNAGENGLFEKIAAKAVCPVTRERLDVGDVSIISKHGTILVERKHVADLISSISDGRYANQRARQLAAVAADETGRTQVVWIVEGPLSGWFALHKPMDFPNGQMEAAIISTAVRDGIPILRALNSEAVAEMVLYLYKRLDAGDLDGAAKAQKRAAAGYGDIVHVKKARNHDAGLTFKMMIATCQVSE